VAAYGDITPGITSPLMCNYTDVLAAHCLCLCLFFLPFLPSRFEARTCRHASLALIIIFSLVSLVSFHGQPLCRPLSLSLSLSLSISLSLSLSRRSALWPRESVPKGMTLAVLLCDCK